MVHKMESHVTAERMNNNISIYFFREIFWSMVEWKIQGRDKHIVWHYSPKKEDYMTISIFQLKFLKTCKTNCKSDIFSYWWRRVEEKGETEGRNRN